MLVLLRGKEDYVFTREDGSRVVAPRKEWYSLCVSFGLGKYELVERKSVESYKKYVGLNPHDFRRSALRNMTMRGVTEKVAMTAHSTRSVFDRYTWTRRTWRKQPRGLKPSLLGRLVVAQNSHTPMLEFRDLLANC